MTPSLFPHPPNTADESDASSVETAEHSDTPVQQSSPSPQPKMEPCANCGADLQGTYCVVCGQRAAHRIVPLWQVTNEFLEDLFDLDLRILRTFPTFFLRPGELTLEYVRGRRRRYIRPLRLYLFSSFLLFTVLAFTNVGSFSFSFPPATDEAKAEVAAVRTEIDALRTELAMQRAGAVPGVTATQEVLPDSSVAMRQKPRYAPGVDQGLGAVDEALAALGPALQPDIVPSGTSGSSVVDGTGGTTVDAPLEAKLLRILRDPGRFVRDMLDRAPYLMFLLVPTFALLLTLLYLRRRRLYLEHLIFALHVHALAFIAFALSAVFAAFDVGGSVHLNSWMAVAPFGYLFVALRTVYGQSFGMVALKTMALLAAYGIILVCALVLLVVGTVALM